MKKWKIKIEGMGCAHCENAIKEALDVDGVKNVTASHVEACVVFETETEENIKALYARISEAGYKPISTEQI